MTDFIWKIEQIETVSQGGLDGVVVTVCFEVSGSDNQHQGVARGDVRLASPDADSFSALSGVTEGQVIGWVKSALTPDGVADFEHRVARSIEISKSARPVVTPMPWSAE